MCGVFGCYMREGILEAREQYANANDIAAHRGPDGKGVVWFNTNNNTDRPAFAKDHWLEPIPPTLILAHRRLAIIDLSDAALQPMANASGNLWLVFNGEIYNYIELREALIERGASFATTSDTEVVLKAFEIWGMAAFERFIGMWAIGIYDHKERRLILSRDRFGIKPLHYFANNEKFAFASEIKQLLALPKVPSHVNPQVLYDYLKFEATDCGVDTFFAGIRRVRPGHCLTINIQTNEISEHRYYSPPVPASLDLSPVEAAKRFRTLLKESVRLHLRADVPVGTCLSGGLDSSSIAMLMREVALDEHLAVQRHSFSSHFDMPEANELIYTKQAIEAAQVSPHFVEPDQVGLMADLRKLVWHQDEPFGSTSIFAQWSVFKLVRDTGVKVVLDGQGADEMLGGYASTAQFFFLELLHQGRLTKLLWETWRWSRLQGKPWHLLLANGKLQKLISNIRLFTGHKTSPMPAERSWLDPEFESAYAPQSEYASNASRTPFGEGKPFANTLYRLFFLNNLPSLLRYEDRNSMAFSVEARVPFLDHRLVDFAFALPTCLKIRHGYTKRVMRDAMVGTLPEEIRMRARKMGFATPEQRWQAGPLRSFIEDAIGSQNLRPYVCQVEAAQYFKKICDNNKLSFAPWRWLNLSLWMNEFGVS